MDELQRAPETPAAQLFPDFIIIGAMKSATSSLYEWLRLQPECFLVAPKETNFFSFHRDWARGLSWYSSLFANHGDRRLLGEASISYTDPSLAPTASQRMTAIVPKVKLIYVIRHPIERLRSHFRHEVQRSRERRTLLEAISEPGNPYVGMSSYHRCLKPYIDRFPPEQMCLVRFDDLVSGDQTGWRDVLKFLDLPQRLAPPTVHNVTSANGQWGSAMLWMKERRILRFSTVAKLPDPVRKLGRRVLIREGAGFERKLARSLEPIPMEITDPIWDDVFRLEEWMGVERPLWDRERDGASRR